MLGKSRANRSVTIIRAGIDFMIRTKSQLLILAEQWFGVSMKINLGRLCFPHQVIKETAIRFVFYTITTKEEMVFLKDK